MIHHILKIPQYSFRVLHVCTFRVLSIWLHLARSHAWIRLLSQRNKQRVAYYTSEFRCLFRMEMYIIIFVDDDCHLHRSYWRLRFGIPCSSNKRFVNARWYSSTLIGCHDMSIPKKIICFPRSFKLDLFSAVPSVLDHFEILCEHDQISHIPPHDAVAITKYAWRLSHFSHPYLRNLPFFGWNYILAASVNLQRLCFSHRIVLLLLFSR